MITRADLNQSVRSARAYVRPDRPAVAGSRFSASSFTIGARVGGAQATKPALRVTVWGAVAMAITASIGKAVGTII